MADVEVTDKVEYGWAEGENLPLLKCHCGQKFGYWEFYIPYKNNGVSQECPNCKKKLYFTYEMKVFIKGEGEE